MIRPFLVALLALAWLALTLTASAADPISIRAGRFELRLNVDGGGHLVQSHLGLAGGPDDKHPAPFHPAGGDGYVWEPALLATHADGNTSTDLAVVGHSAKPVADDVTETRVDLKDPNYRFLVTLVFRAFADEGVIQQWAEVRHAEPGPVALVRFASSSPEIRGRDVRLTHFYGAWADEMNLVEEPLTPGTKVIDSHLGTRADYFANPSFILSMDGPAKETTGEVLAGQLAWSGNFRLAFENGDGHLRAICGVDPFESAYRLPANQTFTTPAMVWAWSDAGKGDVSRNVHRWARRHVLRNGAATRPVLLNNWESTFFKFDEAKLVSLFDGARAVGAETFLLDDGWFGNKHPRDTDHAGLGDWQPNARKLPHGIGYLTEQSQRRGVRFGIWVEPEMVNPRSDLFEQHPDWAIQQPGRKMDLSRNQLVLDLTRPAVRDFVFHTVDDLLTANPDVAYVKWDCNRYITQPGSTYLPAADQQNLFVDYVTNLYDVMAHVSAKHPNVQMMACSGGGGRVDYGVLRYFDSFWPSDNTDPVDRVRIQYGYSHLFPAAALCDHVTHMGNRPLKFAFDVASSGCLGMDLDIAKLSPADRAFAAVAVASYKSFRDVVLGGDLYRLESPYDGPRTSLMYVSPDRSRAVLFVYQLRDAAPTPLALQGLDPARRYVVRERNLLAGTHSRLDVDGQAIDGHALLSHGLTPSTHAAMESDVIDVLADP
jgi:alpha-galactosidase